MLADIGCAGQQKTSRTHSRVENGILEGRLHQLHHHVDDMARRAELTVFPGGCDFTQQILVNIAHDVLVVHVHGVDAIHNFCKHLCCGNQEHGVLHVAAECGVLAFADGFDEREHIGLDVGQHLAGLKVVEYVPTEIFVFRFHPGIFANHACAVLKYLVLQGNAKQTCIGFCLQLVVIQQLHKHQIGDLLQNGNGTGNAARPYRIPYGVDFVFHFASYHFKNLQGCFRIIFAPVINCIFSVWVPPCEENRGCSEGCNPLCSRC